MGRRRHGPHGAVGGRRFRHHQPRLPERPISLRSARLHAPAIRLERTIADLYGLVPEGADDRRPWLDHGRWGVTHPLGDASPAPAESAALRLPAGRGREPAPDPGRAGACRDHRAGAFPLHRQRRDGGAAGGAARLRAQGHRRADARRRYRSSGASSPARTSGDSTVAYGIAFARAVEAALGLEAPSRVALAARADGGARTPRQPFRRHRRDLQRRDLHADACAMRHPARARAARRRFLLRPSPDDGPRRAGRRRGRSVRRTARRGSERSSPKSRRRFRGWSSSTTTPPRCRTGPSRPESSRRRWRGNSAPAAMSAAPRGGISIRAGRPAIRPTTRSNFRVPVLRGGRRRCARLDPHQGGRAEPFADHADPRPAAGRTDRRSI